MQLPPCFGACSPPQGTVEQLEAVASMAVSEDFTDFDCNSSNKTFAMKKSTQFPPIALRSVRNSALALAQQQQAAFIDVMVPYARMSGTVTCPRVPGKRRPRRHSATRLHRRWALSVLSFLGGKEPCPATMPALWRQKEQNAHVYPDQYWNKSLVLIRLQGLFW